MIRRLRRGERSLYLYLLLELQSGVYRFMAVRVLTYVGLLYQDPMAAGEIPAGSRLPPVLPIVLYNGEGTWWARTGLDELQEMHAMLAERVKTWTEQCAVSTPAKPTPVRSRKGKITACSPRPSPTSSCSPPKSWRRW